jgi:ferredoxin
VAPQLFDVDDYGLSSVTRDPVPKDLEEKALLAIANCPEYAIEVVTE